MTRKAAAALLLCVPMTAAAQSTANTPREFELTPTGYVQLDFRSFPDWPVSPAPAAWSATRSSCAASAPDWMDRGGAGRSN